MASAEKRERNGKVYWVSRWRAADGAQRTKTWPGERNKRKAEDYAEEMETDVRRGQYIDPRAGKVTFKAYGELWLASRNFDPNTHQTVEMMLRLHIYPYLGSQPLNTVRPSGISSWLTILAKAELASSYRHAIFAHVNSILQMAVDDDLIRKNPARARSVRRPKKINPEITVWDSRQINAFLDALPARYRILAVLGFGLGLRQGETYGLAVEDVNWFAREVTVRRQVKIVKSKLVFGTPKFNSVRTVPMSPWVHQELSAYLARYKAMDITLPWLQEGGADTTAKLIVTSRERKALNRNYVNTFVWKPALLAAGMEPVRTNGTHVLRHTYASVLLDKGENLQKVSKWLGHKDPAFTLRIYAHFIPGNDDRATTILDAFLADEQGEGGEATVV